MCSLQEIHFKNNKIGGFKVKRWIKDISFKH